MEPVAWENPSGARDRGRIGLYPGHKRGESGAPEIAQSGASLRDLYHSKSRLYSQLRRTVPAGKNHLDRVRRIGRQPGGQQTVCEKTTDALERARRPPFAANPGPSVERGLAPHAVALVPTNEGNAGNEDRVASALPRSRNMPARMSFLRTLSSRLKLRPLESP